MTKRVAHRLIAAAGGTALIVFAGAGGTAALQDTGFVRAIGDGLKGGAIIDHVDELERDPRASRTGREPIPDPRSLIPDPRSLIPDPRSPIPDP